jgi:hypothetical protein
MPESCIQETGVRYPMEVKRKGFSTPITKWHSFTQMEVLDDAGSRFNSPFFNFTLCINGLTRDIRYPGTLG